MAIELNCEHDFDPIVEGNQTVGLKCRHCKKEIREMMALSNIIVTEKEILGLETLQLPADVHHGNYRRKDPRF